jgi:hypothetical protein
MTLINTVAIIANCFGMPQNASLFAFSARGLLIVVFFQRASFIPSCFDAFGRLLYVPVPRYLS